MKKMIKAGMDTPRFYELFVDGLNYELQDIIGLPNLSVEEGGEPEIYINADYRLGGLYRDEYATGLGFSMVQGKSIESIRETLQSMADVLKDFKNTEAYSNFIEVNVDEDYYYDDEKSEEYWRESEEDADELAEELYSAGDTIEYYIDDMAEDIAAYIEGNE